MSDGLCWKCAEEIKKDMDKATAVVYAMLEQILKYGHCHHEPKEKRGFEEGDTVQIKVGAIYGQDFSWHEWRGPDLFFIVDQYNGEEGKIKLTAPGYGEKGNYGNGSIYAHQKDLIFIRKSACPTCGRKL